jgi:hypothetical protein
MHFRPHKTGACNYMHIWVHEWRNACRILFRCREELNKGLEKQLGKYSKYVWRELEIILERGFNIKWPNYYHSGDICGNEDQRLMTTAMQVMRRFNQYLQVELVENGGTN